MGGSRDRHADPGPSHRSGPSKSTLGRSPVALVVSNTLAHSVYLQHIEKKKTIQETCQMVLVLRCGIVTNKENVYICKKKR